MINDYLQDLKRLLQAKKWLYQVGDRGDISAWSWTVVTLDSQICRDVQKIRELGGLLLIGGVYSAVDAPTSKSIGDAIKKARKAQGVSQKALAERIGLGQAAMSKIESGVVEPKASQVFQISHALGVIVESLQ